MVYECINNIQFSLYPATCLLCGASCSQNIDICTPCHDDLPHNDHCCSICALPLSAEHSDNLVCGRCLKLTPAFDRCHTPFAYGYPISGLISSFKFSEKLHDGRLLSKLLINYIETNKLDLPELIIPVPLHRSRLQERGYNQALELALPIGKHFSIPVDINNCKRTRNTKAQSNLDKKDRRKNIRGAFKLAQQTDAKYVVILDDVVTTGNTVMEIARVLKRGGVKRVDVWALARTP